MQSGHAFSYSLRGDEKNSSRFRYEIQLSYQNTT